MQIVLAIYVPKCIVMYQRSMKVFLWLYISTVEGLHLEDIVIYYNYYNT